jgi:DNA processing protein
MNQGIIKKEGPEYPELLKKIKDPPKFLRWKGNLKQEFFEDTLAVVGSRRMTDYGKRTTDYLVREIAYQGITIVSGFMFGVDAAAHRAALSVEGKTIAVMPCGINIIHPEHQEKLYKEISEKGLIVSEFEDDFPPDKWTYPRRNRIVVGLSKAVLVVEAAEKSGSLISANLAAEEQRQLFAVPGPIFSPTSKGTNNLIKNGATSVACPEDVLAFFEKTAQQRRERKEEALTNREKKIVEFLKREPADPDTLARNLQMPVSEVNTILSMLLLKEVIIQQGRQYTIPL